MKIIICDDFPQDVERSKQYFMSLPDGSKEISEDILLEKLVELQEASIQNINSDSENSNKRFIIVLPNIITDDFECDDLLLVYKILKNSETDENVLYKLKEKVKKQYTVHTVKINNDFRTIRIADIDYLECCQRHIIYHMGSNNIETKETLTKVYDILKDYGFYQVHYGYIVNFDKVSHFDKFNVILKNGASVPLSRWRKTDVMHAYYKYTETHYI